MPPHDASHVGSSAHRWPRLYPASVPLTGIPQQSTLTPSHLTPPLPTPASSPSHMGVRGLWRILDPVARPVNSPDILSGQRVAIDASIWIYQFMRALPPGTSGSGEHHLILAGLFRRLCKLLYFDIRPVLVFDGSTPALKRRATRERAERRTAAEERYRRIARKLVAAQVHLRALGQPGRGPKEAQKREDTFESLEDINGDSQPADDGYDEFALSEEEREVDEEYLAQLDVNSLEFSRLPVAMQQEILLAKKEHILRQHLGEVRAGQTRQQTLQSAEALHFSHLQVDALVKRRRVAAHLERLNEGTIVDYEGEYTRTGHSAHALERRIAADATRRYVLVKNRHGGWTMGGERVEDGPMVQPPPPVKEEQDKGDEEEFPFGKPASPIERDPVIVSLAGRSQPAESREALSFDPEEYLAEPVTEMTRNEEQREAWIGPLLPIAIVEEQRPVGVTEDAEPVTPTVPIVSSPGSKDAKDKALSQPVGSPGRRVRLEYNEPLSPGRPPSPSLSSSPSASPLPSSPPPSSSESGFFEELFVSDAGRAQLVERLQAEVESLRAEANPAHSTSLDNELLEDFRSLLTLMNIPWLVAPGEAEAQCAHLQRTGQVDAVISDDNDTLLYGATRLYRHFFSQGQRIVLYLARDMGRELGLTGDRLILLAILLGSDYSVGVRGVGPVKAMQLLKTACQGDRSLEEALGIIKAGLVHGQWPENIEDGDRKVLIRLSIHCAISEASLSIAPQVADQYRRPLLDETASNDFCWQHMLSDLTRLYGFLQSKLHWSLDECRRTIDPIIARRLAGSKSRQTTLLQ